MKRLILLGLIVLIAAGSVGFAIGRKNALATQVVPQAPVVAPLPVASKASQALGILLATTPDEIAQTDIATLNLACLGGLPDTDGIDLDQARDRIAKLAALVKDKTEKSLVYNKGANAKFHDSAEFRALMLMGTLQDEFKYAHEDFSPHPYPTPKADDQGKSRPDEMFFHGSADLDGPPAIDNPVLVVAVGQALGYPVKLVAAPGHLFARWESGDGKTLFDIDETPDVMRPRSDDYLRKRFSASEDEMKEGQFFESLTPLQAFSVALQARGNVLQHLGRLAEADEAYAAAHRFNPDVTLYSIYLFSSVDSELKQLNYSWKLVEDLNAYRFNLAPHPAPKEMRP